MQLSKVKNNSSLFFLFIAFIFLIFEGFVRRGLEGFNHTFEPLKFMALAINLLLLPDYLEDTFPNKAKRIPTLLFTILFFVMLGLLAKEWTIIHYIIYIPVLPLLGYLIKKIDFLLLLKQLPIFILFSIAFVLLYYSNEDAQSPFPFESIVLGEIHVDTVFHASIANMIDSYGIPSLGLNGVPYLHYHWGSHLVFMGLKNLLQIHILSFYGYVYPIVFIPLFLKGLYNFIGQIRLTFYQLEENENSLLFLLVILSAFISIEVFYPFWLIGESNTIATILALNLLAFLLRNFDSKAFSPFHHILIIFIALWMMLFIKVSIGLPLAATLLYLVIRFSSSRKFKITSVVFFLFLIFMMAKATMIRSQGGFSELITSNIQVFITNLFKSNSLFWKFSNGFLHYTFGLFVYLMYRIYFSKSEFKGKGNLKWIFLEGLAFLNFISLALGFYSTGLFGSMNAWYFLFLQLVLSLAVLLAFIEDKGTKYLVSTWIYPLTFLILIVGLVSTKELISIGSREYRDIVFYKEFSNRYNKRETPNNGIEQFVKEGVNFKSRKSTLIFVDTAQHWLYDSQKFRPHAQAFLVQAVYGKATLGALSLHTYSEVNNGYGFKEYRLNTKYPFPDLNQAIIMGHHLKFEELIEIKFPQDSIRIIHHY